MKEVFKKVSILFSVFLVSCNVSTPSIEEPSKTYYTVNFDTRGGSEIPNQQVEEGSKVIKPEDPTNEHYDFLGWLMDSGSYWSFDSVVRSDMTLYADWSRKTYEVKFLNNDGTVLDSQYREYGERFLYYGDVPEYQNPLNRHTYRFIGWDQDLVTTGDMNIHACYEDTYLNKSKTYLDYKGNVLQEYFYKSGDEEPTYDDIPRNKDEEWQYDFIEWVEDESSTEDDVILKPSYNKCSKGLYFNGNMLSSCSTNPTEVVVPSYWNGHKITGIDKRAFADKDSLVSITLPDTITTIEEEAFYDCSNLTTINIPSSVTSIGDRAFYFCNSLRKIALPSSLYQLGSSIFVGCRNLIEVNLPNNLTSIPDGMFSGCESLRGIDLPSSITSIGENAFANCSLLTSFVLPENLKTIKSNAFKNCSSISSIIIPDNVEVIESEAFYQCPISSIILPKKLVSLGSNAFYNNNKDINYSYRGSLDNWLNASLPSFNGELHLFFDDSEEEIRLLTIPEGVENINMNAFYQCKTLESVYLPSTLKTIGARAFYYCSNLSSINIPKGLTIVGTYAFCGCTSLISLSFLNEKITFGDSSFDSCTNLLTFNMSGEVTFKADSYYPHFDGVKSVDINYYGTIEDWLNNVSGVSGFNSNTSVHLFLDGNEKETTNIVIPDTITEIPNYAFHSCRSISSVTIPSSVTRIGQGVFGYCNALNEITAPFVGESTSSERYLGYWFYHRNRNSAASISLPSTLKTVTITGTSEPLSSGRFSCESLIAVNLPASATMIDDSAFYNNTNLRNIILPSSITSIGKQAFYNCKALSLVEVPASVTSIGEQAFSGCTSLTSLTFKEGLETVGEKAFSGCSSLESIVIPSSVTSYGASILSDCNKLKNVSVPYLKYDDGITENYIYTKNDDVKPNGLGYLFGYNGIPTSNEDLPGDTGWATLIRDLKTRTPYYFAYMNYGDLNTPYYFFYLVPKTLESITISNASYLPIDAFNNCQKIKSITISGNVDSIDYNCFRNCRALTYLELPNTVTNINGVSYSSPFYDCVKLTELTFRGNLEEWEEVNKGESWYKTGTNTKINIVHCNDGDINIE